MPSALELDRLMFGPLPSVAEIDRRIADLSRAAAFVDPPEAGELTVAAWRLLRRAVSLLEAGEDASWRGVHD